MELGVELELDNIVKQISKLNLSEIYFLLTFRFRAVFFTLIIKPDMMINIGLLCCRKWWCFLLSSILSFIVGVFSVLFIRACAAIFCRKVNHKVCTSALLLKTKVAFTIFSMTWTIPASQSSGRRKRRRRDSGWRATTRTRARSRRWV